MRSLDYMLNFVFNYSRPKVLTITTINTIVLYDHLLTQRIFTLTLNKILIRTTHLMAKEAMGTIWI